MKDFKNTKFKWTFRTYQQRVLDNTKKYLQNKKIHIVAAPGSGKTILGLEIISRLNSPCIILSPTVTIRDQWQDRFEEAFLNEGEDIKDYFSNDLNNIKLMNTITYQALHSAINNVSIADEEESVDYSHLDLFRIVKEKKITTICLDEAHHLQNEWQKALEKFVKGLEGKVNIVALTATPPYDASEEEWNRYISICGEIDEEIFVPELVKQNTLCPHQDYVYFNYPTKEEIDDFKEYRSKAYTALDELVATTTFAKLYRLVNSRYNFNYGKVYKDTKGYTALLSLFQYAKLSVDKKIVKNMCGENELEELSLANAEGAVRYMLNGEDLDEIEKEEVLNIFKKYSLVNRGKVSLDLNERLRKRLVSSVGKLESIEKIVISEYGALKNKLRMLILTDFIKKESIGDIGTDCKFANISIVTIFEKIRRANTGVKLAALSGGLVILPNSMEKLLEEEFGLTKKDISFKQINDTEYSKCDIKGTNRDKVTLLTELFKRGHIEVLVGTKSLLGEGWDSPCINSLILASFVGSFMLSNQMRGRAIRIFKDDPNKVSNIWHLVTLEPSYILDNDKSINNETSIVSYDYRTLSRRFNCFVGPNYEKGVIESGMPRLTCIKGPYTPEGVASINEEMTRMSLNREGMKSIWLDALGGDGKLCLINVISKRKRLPIIMPIVSLIKALGMNLAYIIPLLIIIANKPEYKILALIIGAICLCSLFKKTIGHLRLFFNHITSKKSIKGMAMVILNSLKSIKKVDYKGKLKVVLSDDKKSFEIGLDHASFEDERTFNAALREFLSLVEDPRYIIIRKNIFKKRDFKVSFALPDALGDKKEHVMMCNYFLKKNMGVMDIVYTRSVYGKINILHYITNSYVVRSDKVESKHKVI